MLKGKGTYNPIDLPFDYNKRSHKASDFEVLAKLFRVPDLTILLGKGFTAGGVGVNCSYHFTTDAFGWVKHGLLLGLKEGSFICLAFTGIGQIGFIILGTDQPTDNFYVRVGYGTASGIPSYQNAFYILFFESHEAILFRLVFQDPIYNARDIIACYILCPAVYVDPTPLAFNFRIFTGYKEV
jgi:hypothetical protein